MPTQQIKTIQTRDCYYPIYHITQHSTYIEGFYFFDEEFEEMGAKSGDYGQGYFGPYPSLDIVCKEQAKHWRAIQSL